MARFVTSRLHHMAVLVPHPGVSALGHGITNALDLDPLNRHVDYLSLTIVTYFPSDPSLASHIKTIHQR
jgi:hypothetical protein